MWNPDAFLRNIFNEVQRGITQGFEDAQATIQNAVENGIQAGMNGDQATIQNAIDTGVQAGLNEVQRSITQGLDDAQATIQNAVENGVQAGLNNVPESVQNLIKGAIRDADETAPALKWWDAFITHTIMVSIFGGSITFTVIVQQIQDPAELHEEGTRFSSKTVRIFLSVAWLLFVTALAITSLITLLFVFFRSRINTALRGGKKSFFAFFFHFLSLLLSAVLLGAFMALSLAVAAYVEVVGWIGCAVTSMTGAVAAICWLIQLYKMFALSTGPNAASPPNPVTAYGG